MDDCVITRLLLAVQALDELVSEQNSNNLTGYSIFLFFAQLFMSLKWHS